MHYGRISDLEELAVSFPKKSLPIIAKRLLTLNNCLAKYGFQFKSVSRCSAGAPYGTIRYTNETDNSFHECNFGIWQICHCPDSDFKNLLWKINNGKVV